MGKLLLDAHTHFSSTCTHFIQWWHNIRCWKDSKNESSCLGWHCPSTDWCSIINLYYKASMQPYYWWLHHSTIWGARICSSCLNHWCPSCSPLPAHELVSTSRCIFSSAQSKCAKCGASWSGCSSPRSSSDHKMWLDSNGPDCWYCFCFSLLFSDIWQGWLLWYERFFLLQVLYRWMICIGGAYAPEQSPSFFKLWRQR